MKFLDALRSTPQAVQRNDMSFQDWINAFGQNVLSYPGQWPGYQFTYGKDPAEPIANSFAGYVAGGLQSNGIIFTLELKRIQVFSQARFQYQRMRKGRPGELFGDGSLTILERPWPGGTTGDMLARMILDADFAGNNWQVPLDGEIVRLRPDYVEIVLAPRMLPLGPDGEDVQVGFKQVGILYYEGGIYSGVKPAVFLPGEYSHFAPIPDPLAAYRGMSWLTPVIRELQADTSATKHKLKFFENAAPQPLHARILTPTGWSTMGAMQPGMHVVGSDGKPHEVLAVYPQGEQDVYRVTFSSGAQAECTADHLWSVASIYDRRRGVTRTMTLGEIMRNGVTYASGPAKWSVPLVAPVEFESGAPLTVDPYLLGSLLGDGYLCGNSKGSGAASLACHSGDVDEQAGLLEALLPHGVRVVRRDRQGNSAELSFASAPGPAANPLTEQLRELGLWGKRGHEKSIPERYLRASVTERVALLQGLMDTDGNIDKRQPNTARFDSTSEALSRGLAELVGGLGGVATVRQSRHGGDRQRPQWHVSISRLPGWINPCRLARKANLYRPTLRGGSYRYIQRVELVGRELAQCIYVESDDHLYVTDDFVLTHNTPNLAVSLPKEITPNQFAAFVEKMDATHKGVDNAYNTLYTGGGADVTIIGANMQQLDFKVTQGAGETRLAGAAGIHPVVAGLSEGMQGASLNAGNWTAAKRNTVDTTFRHLWQNAAGSLEPIAPPPEKSSRLWYDARDIPFLHEDQKDVAQIQQAQASAWRQLVDGGMEPDAATMFIQTNDLGALLGQHSGLYSVQLQPAGSNQEPAGETAPKGPAAEAARSSGEPAADEWDDDPIGELDEDTEALIYALDRIAPTSARALAGAAFNAKHKRGPDGRFLTMVDRIINALNDHKANGGKGDPFKDFDREQLRKAAKARGILLKRGEDRDSIAAKLLADLKQAKPKPAVKAATAAPKKAPKVGAATGQQPLLNHKAIAAAKAVADSTDPQAHNASHQLVVYGALTKADFDSLDSGTRLIVMADLVASASSSRHAPTAQHLISRFSAAGTAPGVVPTPPVIPPASAKAVKNASPSPGGTPGLLVKAKDPGLSGDGWFHPPGGGKAVWGKYGAAGLLLRHRGSDGVDRYLMVQRGPGISDPGKWQFPGGAIDSKETAFQGATREVLEELGFKDDDLAPGLVHGTHEASVAGGWKYTSIAATVPKQIRPNLTTHHARMETSDAKWMTVDEIRNLDKGGKLLAPLAGGKLEKNVVSLFPSTPGTKTAKPAPPPLPVHKPSTGKNLIPDKAAQDKLRADVSAVRKNYRGKTADERLAAIGAMQGYDATPTVVSKKEVDRLLATGDYIEAWRGVNGNIYKTAAQINEEMRSGPAYYGTGIFGNGYYLSTRKNVAVQYSDHTKNSVIRVLIPKAAKTAEHSKVLKRAKQAGSSAGGFSPVGRRNLGGGTLHDEGRYAAAEGLDGIEIPSTAQSAGMGGASHIASSGQPAYNWVNRSVLIIQEADA